MSNSLSLVSEDDLIKELFSRYEHCIFAGIKTGYEGEETLYRMFKYEGNSATCCGLAFQLATIITNDRVIKKGDV